MAILILGSADDEHAMHVGRELQARGQEAVLLDSRWFPGRLELAFDPATKEGEIAFADGSALRLDEITAVYWRNYFGPLGPDLPDAEQAWIAQNDSRSLFESLLLELPAQWVNGWEAYESHQRKPSQLSRLAAAGVPVPRTLITNSGRAVREFAARCPRAIYKPVQGGAHTERLSDRNLSEASLGNLALAPITLQEEVPGEHIRAFVAGDRVLACCLETEALDYRDDPQPRIVAHILPPEIAERMRTVARTLHLLWTGIDLRRTAEGEYVVLEANPSPMFLEFERRSGLPLTAALLDVLLSRPARAEL